MLGLQNFSEMANPRHLLNIFGSEQYTRWKAFRESENARYVALALPRMLLRSPYGMRPEVPGEYQHVEEIRSSEDLLWGNAAFAFATCVANAFTRYGWCGAIRGIEGGGLVEGLPTWVSQDEERDLRSGIEAIITDRREKELADLGFLPLVQIKNTDRAVFFTASSCCRPKRYDNDAASANSRLMCQLSYVLTGARFMHYVKVIARDRVGSYHARGEWERHLNRWIGSYVMSDDQASPAIRAEDPLREARIDVAEDPGKPGSYRVVTFLRPYFQLEELSVSLRIVGRIP
jgi:type VI secretion system protein ImpC